MRRRAADLSLVPVDVIRGPAFVIVEHVDALGMDADVIPERADVIPERADVVPVLACVIPVLAASTRGAPS